MAQRSGTFTPHHDNFQVTMRARTTSEVRVALTEPPQVRAALLALRLRRHC
jgi:hypothetical protein